MKIIANSSPLIALASIQKLSILKELYKIIDIPKAVYNEVVIEGKGRPGAGEVKNGIKEGWIVPREVVNQIAVEVLLFELDLGEAETIILGQEQKAELLILDNREPRRIAKMLKFKVIGTIGVLKHAQEEGKLTDLRETLVELTTKGFWISPELYHKILEE